MNDLARIVAAKSKSQPVQCDAEELRGRLGYDLQSMGAAGYDPAIIAEHERFNQQLEAFIDHPQIGHYLQTLTPHEVFPASGVRVVPLSAIRKEIQELAPAAQLFPLGYMPFATSIGGNAISFHAPTGRVVWANHDSFGRDEITYKDRSTGNYRTVPFSAENVELAVVPLADDLRIFFVDLLSDKIEAKLDALD